MCPPFVSLLVSALFRWPCSISIHLFPMWFVYFCFPASVPALLASAFSPFQHFYSICLPGDFCTSPNRLLLGVLTAFYECPPCCRTACPPSVRPWSPFLLVTVSALSLPSFFLCLRSCLPSCGSLCPSCLPSVSLCLPSCCPSSGLRVACKPLHLSPFVYICLPALDCCARLCLAILYMCPRKPLHLSPSSRLLYPPLP